MKKVNIIICSIVVSLILFLILTGVQKSLIKYEPKIEVLIANHDINKDEKLKATMFKKISAPTSVVKIGSVLTSIDDNVYAKEKIHEGRILFIEDTGSKEELKIIGKEEGCELVSIKLKGPENAISYQIKTGDKVSVYFTGKYVAALSLGVYDSEPIEGKMYTSKILENEEILGIYDANGISFEDERFLKPDTIILSVPREKAQLINNLRSQGTLDITG